MPQDVGQALSAAIKPLATEIRAQGERFEWCGTEGSPIRQAETRTPDLGPAEDGAANPFQVLSDVLVTRLWLLADYLDGMSLVAVHGAIDRRPVAYSLAPVARGAVEVLAYMHWLSDPSIDDRERVARLGVDLCKQTGERGRLQQYATAMDLEITHPWDDIARYLAQWQVSTSSRRRDEPVAVIGEDGNRRGRPGAFEILAAAMPSRSHRYSGAFFMYTLNEVAHAALDGILRPADIVADASTGGRRITFSRPALVRHMQGVYFISYRPLRTAWALLGWDIERLNGLHARLGQPLADAMADSAGLPRERLEWLGPWEEHLPEQSLP